MSHVPGSLIAKRRLNVWRPASAAPPVFGLTWFYGHNLPIPPETVMGAALAQRQAFEAYIDPGFDVLTYESLTAFDQMFNTSAVLNGITMSMPMPTNGGVDLYDPSIYGIVLDVPDGLGRYNTTSGGANYLENMLTEVEAFPDPLGLTRFEFAPAVSWWGAYFTDIGDFTGTLTARITASDLTTADYVLSTGGETNGYLTFLGFIDLTKTYTKIEFFCTAGNTEGWGMDDITCGPASMINP